MPIKNKKALRLAIGAISFITTLAVIAGQGIPANNELKVIFFEVGQGDSIFIQAPTGQQILIDGGPDTGVLNQLGRAMPFYDHTIELMVLTHSHADHIIGLLEVLKRYKVERIVYTGAMDSSVLFQEWQELVKKEGAIITFAQSGQTFEFAQTKLAVLYPFTGANGQKFKDLNESSIVSRLTYQKTDMLFMGDAPASVEKELLDYYQDGSGDPSYPNNTSTLASEVLKVGHHGSRYSSSVDFLQAVKPEYAVIQSGKDNSYGHPHKITLVNLQKLGIKILRNDQLGDIKFVCDGNSCQPNKN